MSDPKRLLDEGTELEARLLGSAMGDAPRRGLGRRVQVALGVSGLAIGTGTASTTAAAASKAAPLLTSLGIAKWVGILALGTGTVVGATAIRRQTSEPSPASVAVPAARAHDSQVPRAQPSTPSIQTAEAVLEQAPPVEPVPPPRAALEVKSPTPGAPPDRARAASPAATAREPAPPELAGELKLLDLAHTALDSGDTQRALTMLDRRDLEYANGNLAPEALALRIQAYALRHDDAKVKELGEQFLARYFTHPEAARVKRWMLGSP